jgi:hypothetical protein
VSDASTLAHDVGKYVARIARNVRPVLMHVLVKDLYELPGGKRASARFDELAPGISPDERLTRARELLAAIDALEPRVRAKDADACARACEHALEVESLLRAVASR